MALQEKVKELSREMKIDLSELNLARVKLITLAVISMASVRSINLKEVANGMMNNVLPSSNYRRLQRFIAEIDWSWVNLPKMILKIVGIEGPYTVLIDRTNWKFGSIDINILVIAVLGEGYAIPVMWSMLPKRGNTAQFERIDILEVLINYLGEGRIKYIIGDREFIGTHYLNWLRANEIGFLLRIKGNMKVKKESKSY